MDVVISGASGLIGTALGAALERDGHRVRRLVRHPVPFADTSLDIEWDPAAGRLDPAALEGADAIVHLAGAGIGDKRWSTERKRLILHSRTDSTRLLAEAVASLDHKPDVFVSGSAIGVYGDRGDDVLTESSAPGDLFLSEVCREWEAAAQPAIDAGIRVALLRTGIVLSAKGGALAKLLPLFKLGAGGRLGSGRQWMSWISIDDEVGVIRWLLDHDVAGPVNAVAPNPVTNAELTTTLAHVLHRPALVPVPSFGPKLLLGADLAHELLFASQRVAPSVLEERGYPFRHPELEGALRAVLER